MSNTKALARPTKTKIKTTDDFMKTILTPAPAPAKRTTGIFGLEAKTAKRNRLV